MVVFAGCESVQGFTEISLIVVTILLAIFCEAPGFLLVRAFAYNYIFEQCSCVFIRLFANNIS